MVEYIVRAQSEVGGFNSSYTSLRDASICVKCIKEVNTHLSSSEKLHGWVTIWEGYSLDDGSKVTITAKLADGLDF